MNPQQLRALFWLRWRVRANQWKRSGWINEALLIVLSWAAVLLALGLLVGSFFAGLLALPDASPEEILYVWDVLVLAFLGMWTTGLLAELQRSDVLSMDKLLHLPVSPVGAFTINYLSSLFCPTLLLFAPVMFGLSLGLVAARGPAMLLLAPLVAALLLMVTAVTHQFQGWLASLMANKRRRRTILFLITALFIVLAQVPNLLVNRHAESFVTKSAEADRLEGELAELERAFSAQEIELPEYQRRFDILQHQIETNWKRDAANLQESLEHTAWLANLVLPPGWMPLGAKAAAQGQAPLAVLGILGLTLLGGASLWRSYRTTLRLYTGQFNSSGKRAAAPPAKSATPAEVSPAANVAVRTAPALLERQLLVERTFPWLPEQASAVAASTFRSLTRAPEVKMILLSPLLMAVILGPMLMRGKLPDEMRPLLGFGAMAFILIFTSQLLSNQFGLDRSGFQVFVLCGMRRQDILLGKNMAVAPYAFGMGLVVVVVMQVILPMRLDYFLAVPPQFLSMFLLFCLPANWLSILAPMRVPVGTLRGAKPSLTTIVLQIVFSFVFFPLAMVPTLLPLGLQILLEQQGMSARIPVCLLMSLAECVAVVYLYRLVLSWQGNLLQERELQILTTVKSKEE